LRRLASGDPDRLRRLLAGGRFAAGDHDPRTRRGEVLGNGAADAAAGTGDYRDFAVRSKDFMTEAVKA